MDCEKCEYFVTALKKPYAYLFDKNGFKMVHCAEARQGDYCMVVFESAQCRIKFEIEQGVPTCYLGTLESPTTWGNEVNNVRVWYVADSVLDFIEKKPLAPAGQLFPRSEKPPTLDDMLSRDSGRLHKHLDQVVAAFAPDRSPDWWKAYNAYQDEKVRKIREQMGL